MIGIEEKIASFNKMVHIKAKEVCHQKLSLESKNKQQMLEDKIKRLEAAKDDFVSRRVKFANQRKNEMIQKSIEESTNARIQQQNILLGELEESIKQNLENYVKTPEYTAYLKKSLAEQNLQKFYRIAVVNRDKDIVQKILGNSLEIVEADISIIGGYILYSKNGRTGYDNTFLAAIEDNEYQIGKLLYSALERNNNEHR